MPAGTPALPKPRPDRSANMNTQSELSRLREIVAQLQSRKARAQSIADQIRTAGKFRWVGLYDVDHDQSQVTNIAWSGPAAPAFPTFPITKGLTSRAISKKQTINIGEVAADTDYLTALGSTRSEIIIPILKDESQIVVGTLDVESEHPNAFPPEIQSFLEECAKAIRPLWQ
jgi:L-methionine (R)-S-oxide reductase